MASVAGAGHTAHIDSSMEHRHRLDDNSNDSRLDRLRMATSIVAGQPRAAIASATPGHARPELSATRSLRAPGRRSGATRPRSSPQASPGTGSRCRRAWWRWPIRSASSPTSSFSTTEAKPSPRPRWRCSCISSSTLCHGRPRSGVLCIPCPPERALRPPGRPRNQLSQISRNPLQLPFPGRLRARYARFSPAAKPFWISTAANERVPTSGLARAPLGVPAHRPPSGSERPLGPLHDLGAAR